MGQRQRDAQLLSPDNVRTIVHNMKMPARFQLDAKLISNEQSRTHFHRCAIKQKKSLQVKKY